VLLHAGADGEARNEDGESPEDLPRAKDEVRPPERFCPPVLLPDCAVRALIQPCHAHMSALDAPSSLMLACAAKMVALLRAVATERARCIAFAMGLRERLGAASLVRALDPEVVRMVLDQV